MGLYEYVWVSILTLSPPWVGKKRGTHESLETGKKGRKKGNWWVMKKSNEINEHTKVKCTTQ